MSGPTPAQREIYDAHQGGKSLREIARETGRNESTVRKMYHRAKRWIEAPSALRDGAAAIGADTPGALVWTKTNFKGEVAYSVQHSNKQTPEDIAAELDVIVDAAIERIQSAHVPAPAVNRPKDTDSTLMGFLPLFDAHLGLSMPGYGLADAVERISDAAFEALDAMPASVCVAIVNGGDFTHQNDDNNQTPQSKHPLPIDGTYLDATDAAIDLRIAITERAAAKFDRVITKDLRGNHDPHTARIVRAALAQRYREHERISFDLDGIDYWRTVWGQNLITAHHGDIKRSLKDIALGLSQKYRVERGQTKYHEHHYGHTHHVKETRLDVGGVHMCQHSALSVLSNYEADNLFGGDSILQAITYRKSGGRKGALEIYLG